MWMLILVHINGNRHRQNAYKTIIWIETIIVTLFVHFVYYDIQLTKVNKQVNREKKIGSNWKLINLGYRNNGTHYVYGSKQSTKELISRYNWLWKHIVGFVISYFHKFWLIHGFEKQTKKRLSFCYRLPVVQKGLKKCLVFLWISWNLVL